MINPNAKNYFTNKMCIKLEKAQTIIQEMIEDEAMPKVLLDYLVTAQSWLDVVRCESVIFKENTDVSEEV